MFPPVECEFVRADKEHVIVVVAMFFGILLALPSLVDDDDRIPPIRIVLTYDMFVGRTRYYIYCDLTSYISNNPNTNQNISRNTMPLI